MKKNKQAATVRLSRETRGSRLLTFARLAMLQGHPTQTNPPFPPDSPTPFNGLIAVEALANTLASTRLGRVLLHALCLLRHPARSRWHWQGIVRELRVHSLASR